MKQFILAYYLTAFLCPIFLPAVDLGTWFFPIFVVSFLFGLVMYRPKGLLPALGMSIGALWGVVYLDLSKGRDCCSNELEEIIHRRLGLSEIKYHVDLPVESFTVSKAYGFTQRIQGQLRVSFQRDIPPSLLRYYQSMFLQHSQAFGTKKALKELGIYHLLVISGFHVNIFFSLVFWLLSIPVRLLGVYSILSPPKIMTLMSVVFYCQFLGLFALNLAMGISHPLVRASLFSVFLSHQYLGIKPERKKTLLFIGFIHILLFPEGAMSTSFLLTWTISLLFLFPQGRSQSLGQRIYQLFLLQLLIGTTCISLLGEGSIQGFLINFFFCLVFPILVLSMIINAMASFWNIQILLGRFDLEGGLFDILFSAGRFLGDWPLVAGDSVRLVAALLVFWVLSEWSSLPDRGKIYNDIN